MRNTIIAVLGLTCCCFVSCDSSPTTSKQEPTLEERLALTPRSDSEAEEMAVDFYHELVASDETYFEFHTALELLRNEIREENPEIASIIYSPAVNVRSISLHVDSVGRELIRSGMFVELNEVSESFRMISIDTSWFPNDRWGQYSLGWYVELNFKGILYSPSMVKYFEELPHLNSVDASAWFMDRSNIYPYYHNGELTMVVRRGSMGCPNGCMKSELWYYRFTNGRVSLVGEWDMDNWDNGRPDWWSEAAVNMNLWTKTAWGIDRWPVE